ncbi:MAG: preprotein translocase subunit SecA [Patescibacteria group bacterium]
MSFLSKIFGDPNAKVISEVKPLVEAINSFESKLLGLTDEQLKAKTQAFKERFAAGETLDDLLPEAFAVVREASRRLTGMRHFDVQMIGGIMLHRGHIAEMRTGEGKTLVATLPAYLNALTGKGVHVVTVNDYLAKRDAVWMGQIYDFLGLSVGIIQNLLVSYKYTSKKSEIRNPKSETNPNDQKSKEEIEKEEARLKYLIEYEHLDKCERKEAYQCDIIYGTNNEYGFDYLRDNMVNDLSQMSQRPLHYAIVDEVDSILIDEARTPLIISAPAEKADDTYYKFAELVEKLNEKDDYNVDEKMRSATLTDGGIKKMENFLGVDNIYAEDGMSMVHHLEQALRAMALFKRDRDYVIDNGEVMIVDEFTGRKMPGRRYSEGLHQAIEAKEKVEIQRESQTMATITFQNYFRMYEKISGMTGTAVTEAEEFGKIYKLEVVVIPTNKPNNRLDRPDRIYKTEEAKYKALITDIRALQEKGQPVLIGTVSVVKNEELSYQLEREGIKHEILNAKNHEREGEIIAQAGRPGAVTLATNMAGRGVDIILGGNPPDKELAEKTRAAGGLFVIGTERHESRRIDNQLRGRSGRQGDPGETQFYLSTDDDLMRIFAGERLKRVMTTLRIPDDMPIEQGTITRLIESAQKKVEGFHFDTRKHLLEYDDVINRHREVIYGKRKKLLEAYAREKKGEVTEGETLRGMVMSMVEEEIEQVISFHTNSEDQAEWNMKEISEVVSTIFPLRDEEKQKLLSFSKPSNEKMEMVDERERIVLFLMELAKKKYEDLLVKQVNNNEVMIEIEKQVLLKSIDNLWVDHLVAIDYLRTGIGLRGYGQRDPLVEYKRETYRMFNELLNLIQKEVVYTIYKMNIGIQLAPSIMESGNLQLRGAQKTLDGDDLQVSQKPGKTMNADGKEVGRNDPCPCGSGKKFKKCHGA